MKNKAEIFYSFNENYSVGLFAFIVDIDRNKIMRYSKMQVFQFTRPHTYVDRSPLDFGKKLHDVFYRNRTAAHNDRSR